MEHTAGRQGVTRRLENKGHEEGWAEDHTSLGRGSRSADDDDRGDRRSAADLKRKEKEKKKKDEGGYGG